MRISDHIICIGTNLVDMGALTNFWYLFQNRENIYGLLEACCGARLTVSYVRVGGLAIDVPDDFVSRCRGLLESIPRIDRARIESPALRIGRGHRDLRCGLERVEQRLLHDLRVLFARRLVGLAGRVIARRLDHHVEIRRIGNRMRRVTEARGVTRVHRLGSDRLRRRRQLVRDVVRLRNGDRGVARSLAHAFIGVIGRGRAQCG